MTSVASTSNSGQQPGQPVPTRWAGTPESTRPVDRPGPDGFVYTTVLPEKLDDAASRDEAKALRERAPAPSRPRRHVAAPTDPPRRPLPPPQGSWNVRRHASCPHPLRSRFPAYPSAATARAVQVEAFARHGPRPWLGARDPRRPGRPYSLWLSYHRGGEVAREISSGLAPLLAASGADADPWYAPGGATTAAPWRRDRDRPPPPAPAPPLAPRVSDLPPRVGIYGANSPAWLLVEAALHVRGHCAVPLCEWRGRAGGARGRAAAWGGAARQRPFLRHRPQTTR